MSDIILTAEPEAKTMPPSGLADVHRTPLGRLARQHDSEGLRRLLPGIDAKRVAVAAFQSSI